MSLGGSFYSPDIEDYYTTPWELGYGKIVKFDHDFVGRDALEAMAGGPHRRKVTLVWNADDVLSIFQRLLEDGPLAMHVDLPLAATARMHYDKVLGADGSLAGLATYPAYTVNERAMLSLATLDEPQAEPGAEVVLVWGEDGGGSRSAPWIEPHEQVEIRATVAPAPISEAARRYRSAVTRR
jgi:vanillate/3-O-methylgallate O-demethylase